MSSYKKRGKSYYSASTYTGVSLQVVVVILLGVFGGKKLDAFLDTSPIFTLLFSLLSVALAMYVLIIKTKKT